MRRLVCDVRRVNIPIGSLACQRNSWNIYDEFGEIVVEATSQRKKPGPKPKSPEGSATRTVSFRVRPAFLEPLEMAAKLQARSLSEECEHRLSRSVTEEAAVATMFGDIALRPLLLAIANAARVGGTSADDVDEREQQAMAAVIVLIDKLSNMPADKLLKAAGRNGCNWGLQVEAIAATKRAENRPAIQTMAEIMGR